MKTVKTWAGSGSLGHGTIVPTLANLCWARGSGQACDNLATAHLGTFSCPHCRHIIFKCFSCRLFCHIWKYNCSVYQSVKKEFIIPMKSCLLFRLTTFFLGKCHYHYLLHGRSYGSERWNDFGSQVTLVRELGTGLGFLLVAFVIAWCYSIMLNFIWNVLFMLVHVSFN